MTSKYQDLLDLLDAEVELADAFEAGTRFMVSMTAALRLPPEVRSAVAVVVRYLDGDEKKRAVEQARGACWESIEGRISEPIPEVSAVRAALCAMSPRSEWRGFETLDLFGDFAQGAGLRYDQLEAGLITAFPVLVTIVGRS